MKKILLRLKLIVREYLEAFYALYLKCFIKKPTVINLNANDVCNSKCTMCNIWKQKKTYEMSPDEFLKVLKDPLYSKVKHVGITGGEPTLRNDLVEIYRSVINALPSLKGVSIITNSIKHDVVTTKIYEINELCKTRGVNFSVMVSLDGVEQLHDKIRGIPGNFESSVKTINAMKKAGIPISIGCTISKENVWGAEELLYYLKVHDIYGRFRVAEFIERLYNNDRSEVIKNFDEEQTYQLKLFFKKLELTFEKNQLFKRTYRNIINMLGGGKREIGCPYQSNGVVLNSRGEVSYCAPRSPIIGNTLEKSSNIIYKNSKKVRRLIKKNQCDGCIHDYHYYANFKNANTSLKTFLFDILYKSNFPSVAKIISFFLSLSFQDKNNLKDSVYITGWYGTETVGDKAILGGIIDSYKAQGIKDFIITSLHPFVTERTLKELGIKAKVVNVYSKEFLIYPRYCKEVVMGGGPLMDIAELYLPRYSFELAKMNNVKTVVFGCGLGPLKVKKYKNTVKSILNKADVIKLRDRSSLSYARDILFVKKDIEMTGDPAKNYVSSIEKNIMPERTDVIRCFFREWTFEYAPKDYSYKDYLFKKEEIEKKLVKQIYKMREELKIDKVELCNMHNFIVGFDDRDFSRYFIHRYFKNCSWISYDDKLTDVNKTIFLMKSSKLNLCMRFHSVLFAHTLNTDFLAIDYTMGGKIHNYITDNQVADKLISLV